MSIVDWWSIACVLADPWRNAELQRELSGVSCETGERGGLDGDESESEAVGRGGLRALDDFNLDAVVGLVDSGDGAEESAGFVDAPSILRWKFMTVTGARVESREVVMAPK